MADIEVFRAKNTTGLAINGMRVTNTKPYGLIQTTQLFKCKDENIIEALGADVQPVTVIKELQGHIKQRILETAFNNGGIYSEVAEDIANRIDFWVDEFISETTKPQF